MVGTLFNFVQTKKTGTGQDVLEKHQRRKGWSAHMCFVCECRVCTHRVLRDYVGCVCTWRYWPARTDGNDSVTQCYLS